MENMILECVNDISNFPFYKLYLHGLSQCPREVPKGDGAVAAEDDHGLLIYLVTTALTDWPESRWMFSLQFLLTVIIYSVFFRSQLRREGLKITLCGDLAEQ